MAMQQDYQSRQVPSSGKLVKRRPVRGQSHTAPAVVQQLYDRLSATRFVNGAQVTIPPVNPFPSSRDKDRDEEGKERPEPNASPTPPEPAHNSAYGSGSLGDGHRDNNNNKDDSSHSVTDTNSSGAPGTTLTSLESQRWNLQPGTTPIITAPARTTTTTCSLRHKPSSRRPHLPPRSRSERRRRGRKAADRCRRRHITTRARETRCRRRQRPQLRPQQQPAQASPPQCNPPPRVPPPRRAARTTPRK